MADNNQYANQLKALSVVNDCSDSYEFIDVGRTDSEFADANDTLVSVNDFAYWMIAFMSIWLCLIMGCVG